MSRGWRDILWKCMEVNSFVNLSQFHSVFTQVKYWNEWWCHSTRIRRRFRRRNHESGRIDNNVVVTSAIFGRAKGKKWFGADEWKRLDVQQIVSLLSGIFPAPRWMGLKMKRDQLTHRIWRLSKAAGRIRWICGVIAAWQRFSEGENWEKNESFIHSFQFLASFQGPYLRAKETYLVVGYVCIRWKYQVCDSKVFVLDGT